MASFSFPCPKVSASASSKASLPYAQLHPHTSISFSSDSTRNSVLLGGSLQVRGSQASSKNQRNVFRVRSQLNDVAVGKLSNSTIPEQKSEESTKNSGSKNTIPDVASFSAFMNQVADLVELVDSRDISELQLKQLDCEVLIRKKEALPPPPAAAHHPPQVMLPFQPPPAAVAAPAAASPVPSSPASPPSAPAKPTSNLPSLKCPMAGTFYRCPAPGAPAFVKVGDKVQKGQVVCIIEAMKLMNEIEADQSGTIVEILVDDAKPVSVDTPLFIIEP